MQGKEVVVVNTKDRYQCKVYPLQIGPMFLIRNVIAANLWKEQNTHHLRAHQSCDTDIDYEQRNRLSQKSFLAEGPHEPD